jgi:hypothetical protein
LPPIVPNEGLLFNALAQGAEINHYVAQVGWKGSLVRLLDSIDIRVLKDDVGPFLEHPEEVELLDPAHIRRLLS